MVSEAVAAERTEGASLSDKLYAHILDLGDLNAETFRQGDG